MSHFTVLVIGGDAFPQMDDEGNDAGALATKNELLPVIGLDD